ncbi:hypothetical protein METBIDRAFT_12389 [Metschnikowia bicuspidata var. bicuspidata NRRL YB-4993]|uniref:Uncharacterized protein n=1 Tax=Metschnikowia bicuspidata var. bicuspidata NRRL YB-4993 TaxID=869754 RepID=A0A1A0H8C9_9ASCO|nr:hypothetical protein METBIDRAFT_12389 [Metschnikowia bicuspidata var. bicuspidata NRRL YB-4993]OBA20369.1 hypothetical protein METBIDRAFT_12389 [Metschnikowia bicuspidata var. bicuspidata NRRL YB-4993]
MPLIGGERDLETNLALIQILYLSRTETEPTILAPAMENLRTALSLAFIAGKHIAIHTDDYAACLAALRNVVLLSFSADDMVEIDLHLCPTYNSLVSQMVKSREGERPQLYKVVIWKNLEALEATLRVKSDILRVFDEIERYNTLASRDIDKATPIRFGEYLVTIPDMFVIVPVMAAGDRFPRLHRQVKDRIWFCQSFCHVPRQETPASEIPHDKILRARQLLPAVFANAEIQEYVCSLMVFTRSHRLCSLAPLTTRPSMRAAEGILVLAKALVAWASLDDSASDFVTPDFVKIAYRKIGYWIVDWETNQLFQGGGSELRKRTEISVLTGDWYGSEWACVKKYLDKFRAHSDPNSTTGYTNRIVEDVLKSVLPPL